MKTFYRIMSWISLIALLLSCGSLVMESLSLYTVTQGTVRGSEFGMLISLGALESRMGFVMAFGMLWGLCQFAIFTTENKSKANPQLMTEH